MKRFIFIFNIFILSYTNALSQEQLTEQQLSDIEKIYHDFYNSLIDTLPLTSDCYTINEQKYYERLFQSAYGQTDSRSHWITLLIECGHEVNIAYRYKVTFMLNIILNDCDNFTLDTSALNFSVLTHDHKNRYKGIMYTEDGVFIGGSGWVGSKRGYKEYKNIFKKALDKSPDYILFPHSTYPGCLPRPVVSYIKDGKIYHLSPKPTSKIHNWFAKKWRWIYLKLFF